jgi:hypothetical protein
VSVVAESAELTAGGVGLRLTAVFLLVGANARYLTPALMMAAPTITRS